MGKKVMWRYWGFSAMDNRAAQVWLNEMAAGGWELEGIYLDCMAKFAPAEGKWSYFVDWSDGALDEETDYLDLCREAGWIQVCKARYLNIYRAAPGTTPIQTDPAEEYRRFKTQVAKRAVKGWAWMWGLPIGLLLFGRLLGIQLEPPGMIAAQMLASSFFGLLLICLPVFLAVGLFQAVRMFRLWRGWK